MDHTRRMARLQRAVLQNGWHAAVLTHSRDLYYFTGTAQPGWLVARPGEYLFYVRSGLDFARARYGLPLETLRQAGSFEKVAAIEFPGDDPSGKVGAELDLLTANQAGAMAKALGGRSLEDCSPVILTLRMIKDQDELNLIEKACEVAHAGHLAAVAVLKSGISELEFAAAMENAQRLAGHEGVFFFRQPDVVMSRGPLASGPNLHLISGAIFTLAGVGLSSAVPAGPSTRIIGPGELILADIPPCVAGYHADQTRMYCLGRPSDEALSMQDKLRALSDLLLQGVRPGVTAGQVYEMAMECASQHGVLESFQAFPDGRKAHFVGHGIGLEISEPPLLAPGDHTPIQAGMVLALEMHLLNDSTAVKLEDTILVEPNGSRPLTLSPRGITTAQ